MLNSSIRPSLDELRDIAAGTFDCLYVPYQYVNWAAEKLDKEPRFYVGGTMELGALIDLYDAAKLELEENGL